jgi:histone H3/H4
MFEDFARVVAQTLNVKLTDDSISSLSTHAELELRVIIEDAAKYMRKAKRTVLLPEDINFALQSRNQQVYYFSLISHF